MCCRPESNSVAPLVHAGASGKAPQTMFAAGLVSGAFGYGLPTPLQLLKVGPAPPDRTSTGLA